MNDLGRVMITIGAVIVGIGLLLLLAGRLNLPIGRLPGDISWRSKSGNSSFYFPIVTCIVVSVLLSLMLWVVNSFRR